MARVFVADESALGRKVVIKVLPPETAAQVSLERFKREILLAARLQHPHIVPLLSSGESNGLPYFTMPFVEGESLRVRLARHGELPVSDAIRLLRGSPRRSPMRTSTGSCTATSSPTTCCSRAGARWSRTSVSRKH